ncbi:MAG: phosphatase PAP2 family protein [Candidatus Heimdallarchaeota archaeon]|nr:phosphatase PAP2 family protein [Candidatus Heimdallarchaeota archaeon]
MGWFFSESINIWFQETFPWLEIPFKIITFFGDSIIFIVLLSIAFWVYNKREAIIAMYVLLTTTFLNFFLKVLIHKPRPPESIRLIDTEGFSTPSGHAQGSSTMYGWIALHFKKIWLYIVSAILIILIALSRVFLGVHYIGDIIIGLVVGLTVLVGLYFAIPPITQWLEEKWSDGGKVLLGLGYGLIVFLTTFFLGLFADWPPGDTTNSANICAALMAVPIAVWLEAKWIKMKTKGIDWRSKLLRVIVGLAIVIGLYFGLSTLFDLIETTNYSAVFFLDFTRYLIVTFIATLGLPYLFVTIKWFSLEKKEQEELSEEKALTP